MTDQEATQKKRDEARERSSQQGTGQEASQKKRDEARERSSQQDTGQEATQKKRDEARERSSQQGTNREAAQKRDEARERSSEQSAKDRSTSPQERADQNRARNAERKQTRTAAEGILESGSVSAKFRDIVGQGGSTGRKLARELAKAERTGRVSSWLAGETVKAQAAQNAAQQSQFRADVLDVVSYGRPVPLGGSGFLPPLAEKPLLHGNFSLPPPILGKTHVLAHDPQGKVYWMPAAPC